MQRWMIALLLLMSPLARAGAPIFANPDVTPEVATRFEEIVYSVDWDGCGSPLEPVITVADRVVRIVQPVRVLCSLPPAVPPLVYRLGPFPPGAYRIEAQPCAATNDGSPCIPGTAPPDVTFRVVGGTVAPAAAPTLGQFGLGVLVLVLMMAASRDVRRRT